MWCARDDPSEPNRCRLARLEWVADVVLFEFTCAPTGDVQPVIIDGQIDIGDERGHGTKGLKQRRQGVGVGRLGGDSDHLVDGPQVTVLCQSHTDADRSSTLVPRSSIPDRQRSWRSTRRRSSASAKRARNCLADSAVWTIDLSGRWHCRRIASGGSWHGEIAFKCAVQSQGGPIAGRDWSARCEADRIPRRHPHVDGDGAGPTRVAAGVRRRCRLPESAARVSQSHAGVRPVERLRERGDLPDDVRSCWGVNDLGDTRRVNPCPNEFEVGTVGRRADGITPDVVGRPDHNLVCLARRRPHAESLQGDADSAKRSSM
jgi:hypothetical protein